MLLMIILMSVKKGLSGEFKKIEFASEADVYHPCYRFQYRRPKNMKAPGFRKHFFSFLIHMPSL